MAVWWLNDVLSLQEACRWIPRVDDGGKARSDARLLSEVAEGDLLVSYDSSRQSIVGLLRAESAPRETTRPEGYAGRPADARVGVLLDVEVHTLPQPVRLPEIAKELNTLAQGYHWPLTVDGKVKRPVCHRFSPEGLRLVRQASSEAWPDWAEAAVVDPGPPNPLADPAWARALMEAWLPDEAMRRAILALVADDIVAAHGANPRYWFLAVAMPNPPTPNWVSLMLHNITLVTVKPNGVGLGVDFGEQGSAAVTCQAGNFKSMSPTARFTVTMPPAELIAVLPQVGDAHTRFRETAAANVWSMSYANSHSTGLMQYLREFLQRDLPEPVLPPPPTGRYWAFQGDPDLVRGWPWLESLRPGDTGWWMVGAHRDEMQPGDQVLIWRTGQRPGIVALAELTSAPHQNRPADVSQTDTDGYWVDLRFTRVLGDDLPKSRVLDDPVLREMRVVRGARGSNFAVQPREWEALMALIEPMRQLVSAFAAAGLHYTPEQLATFFTALSTKGFVILSGISGTGKSKIAQRLAELLPTVEQLQLTAEGWSDEISVKPYMLRYGRLVLPGKVTRLFRPEPAESSKEVEVRFGDQAEVCGLWQQQRGDHLLAFLNLRQSAKAWLTGAVEVGSSLFVRPEIDGEGNPTGFELATAAQAVSASTDAPIEKGIATHLFLPVRPDWRDSKPLLGYYNPLTGEYQSTEFLRFLQRAKANWDGPEDEQVAFLVILDEMNLARVEYYFADLLSILESGRYEEGSLEGLTKEALTFGAADDFLGEADLPPDLNLPPNLYIVGTVNVDETTHGFSPKVLDRAFTIELNDVDFETYAPGQKHDAAVDDATKAAVLDLLCGRPSKQPWARITKPQVAYVMGEWPAIPRRLQELNSLLRPHYLHFGYRVFDEICAFIDWAEWNKLWSEPFDWDAAFDAAVLMKVLPKFHGSKAKLLAPLEALKAWCGEGMPRTRARVQRMLDELGQVGFTAFS